MAGFNPITEVPAAAFAAMSRQRELRAPGEDDHRSKLETGAAAPRRRLLLSF
jgi:hypothetical protein